MKQFNTTAICIPSKHYMVDLTDRVREIKKLVDEGRYFTINRARQYGKTTTLTALKNELSGEYSVLFLDFQSIGESGYSSEVTFVQELSRLLWNRRKLDVAELDSIADTLADWKDAKAPRIRLGEFFDTLMEWCESLKRDIVLIIDEVDTATNNQVFLDFLAQLREKYISRDRDGIKTFKSVILAGVTDVKHLKSKIRQDADAKENSPWNIAADFTIDMSLPEKGIQGMLDEYEADHHAGMNTKAIAKLIRDYTNGYPFLVSRICELVDATVGRDKGLKEAWTQWGIDEAVKIILSENSTLFQSMTKNLNNYPELKASIRSILMEGTKLSWSPDQDDIVRMQMLGIIRNENNSVRIDNRIFETRLYNWFLSDEELRHNRFFKEGDLAKNIFVENGKLNVRKILEHFIDTYHQIYGNLEDKFLEKDGRELFLLYLKPIINGTGNYYIEAQTRDQKRTDVIIDYLGQQYIIEMKIWRGERYLAEGEQQICEYLDYYGLDTGFMLSFNFNQKKKTGVVLVHVGDKLLYEGIV